MTDLERVREALSTALPDADGLDAPPNAPAFRELRERISALADQLAAAEAGPTALVAALVELGIPRLAPLAAERYHHAAVERRAEHLGAELAERAPIFGAGRAIYAVPVGALGPEGQARFCDRVLAAVLRAKPGRVHLVLDGFAPHAGAAATWDALQADLAAQDVELICPAVPPG